MGLEEELLEKIGPEDLEKRVTEKMGAFSGLLNREGALYAISREEGINQYIEQPAERAVTARVKRVFPRRFFGSNGSVRTAIAEENGREFKIVFWNEQSFLPIPQNFLVQVKGYREKEGELHTTNRTVLTILDDSSEELVTVSQLLCAGEGKVRASVKNVEEPRVVSYCPKCNSTKCGCPQGKRESLILNFTINDNTGEISSVAFFDCAEDLLGITGQGLERSQKPIELLLANMSSQEKLFYGVVRGGFNGSQFIVRGFCDYGGMKNGKR